MVLNLHFLVLLIWTLYRTAQTTCIDKYTNCPSLAGRGDCEMETPMFGYCAMSCNTPSKCIENSTEMSHLCPLWASAGRCRYDTFLSQCPITCGRQQNISCGQPDKFPNAVAIGHWTYMSRVTYSCSPGYVSEGETAFRVCSVEGFWRGQSTPICVPDNRTDTNCGNNFQMAFEKVKRLTVSKVSILTSWTGGTIVDCSDFCLRLYGCTHFAFKNNVCDIYYHSGNGYAKPRTGEIRKKLIWLT